jgi:hypothetical protein
MKNPFIYIEIGLPMNRRVNPRSPYVWKRAHPSPVIALHSMLYLSDFFRDVAQDQLRLIAREMPLVWSATLHAMFGADRDNPDRLQIERVAQPDSPNAPETSSFLARHAILTITGKSTLASFLSSLREDHPFEWPSLRPRLMRVSPRFIADVDHCIARGTSQRRHS